MRLGLASLLLLLAVGAPACGDLGDADDRPPLGIIEGELTTTSTTPSSSHMRIAIVWGVRGDGSPDRPAPMVTSQDVPVTPILPARFRIELSDPPPKEAIAFGALGPPTVRGAGGVLVVYEDVNANGKLDLVDEGASSFVDQVLAVDWSDGVLIWVEGSAPPGMSLGYQFLRRDPSCKDVSCEPFVVVPLTGGIHVDIPLTADPAFATAMCRTGANFIAGGVDYGEFDETPLSSPDEAPIGSLPPPPPEGWPAKDARGEPQCSLMGTAYAYRTCTPKPSSSVCIPRQGVCQDHLVGLPSKPPPPNWPCTLLTPHP